MRLALASTSPRRRELLARAGYAFEVIASQYEEDMGLRLAPADLARELAEGKARTVASSLGAGWLVLGADTIVSCGGEVMSKPEDEADALRMLRLLSGRVHEVITGYAVVDGATGVMRSGAVSTRVRFRALSDGEIAEYVAAGEPMDKAGAYAIQGGAAAFVESIDGPMDNVVGLPMKEVSILLESLGIIKNGETSPY